MKNISVVGAGTMGNGIAHSFASKGFQVSLIDNNPSALERAIQTIQVNLDRQVKKGILTEQQKLDALKRIQVKTDLKAGVQKADLIIEAATENENIKLNLFQEIDKYCLEGAILASNTSSISITKIASVTKDPSRVIGMHFMNPVPVMELVEVISGYATSEETLQAILSLTHQLGKTPVRSKDFPGFIANRILMPMINEAIYTVHEGIASIEEIDSVMKLGMAHPMGPLQLADFIGLDTCLSILTVLHQGFGNPKYAPCPLLVNMVNANHLGRKTGKGFYTY